MTSHGLPWFKDDPDQCPSSLKQGDAGAGRLGRLGDGDEIRACGLQVRRPAEGGVEARAGGVGHGWTWSLN